MSSQTPTGWCWDGEMQRRYNPGFEERRWQEYTPDAGRPGGPGYAQSSLPPLLPPPATGSSSFILSTQVSHSTLRPCPLTARTCRPPNIPLQQPLSSTQTCSGYASHEIDANHRSVPLSGPVSPERTSRRRQSLSANHNRTSLFNPLHSGMVMVRFDTDVCLLPSDYKMRPASFFMRFRVGDFWTHRHKRR